MADVVSREKRSEMMSGIGSKNTKPEMLVRRALHHRGLRFRLHRRGLPGRPDIYLPKYKAAVFVNGCFWHAHDCSTFKWPKTRNQFWKDKLISNRKRDQQNRDDIRALGIRHFTVWECETRLPAEEFVSVMDDLASSIMSP